MENAQKSQTEKAITFNPYVIKSLIDFANFIGDRPMPEYSKSMNLWRWWNNATRDYDTATTEELLDAWKKSINVL